MRFVPRSRKPATSRPKDRTSVLSSSPLAGVAAEGRPSATPCASYALCTHEHRRGEGPLARACSADAVETVEAGGIACSGCRYRARAGERRGVARGPLGLTLWVSPLRLACDRQSSNDCRRVGGQPDPPRCGDRRAARRAASVEDVLPG